MFVHASNLLLFWTEFTMLIRNLAIITTPKKKTYLGPMKGFCYTIDWKMPWMNKRFHLKHHASLVTDHSLTTNTTLLSCRIFWIVWRKSPRFLEIDAYFERGVFSRFFSSFMRRKFWGGSPLFGQKKIMAQWFSLRVSVFDFRSVTSPQWFFKILHLCFCACP